LENVLVYFVVGFLTAFGWWAAGKVTNNIDSQYEQREKD
jgi:hypothetical protein